MNVLLAGRIIIVSHEWTSCRSNGEAKAMFLRHEGFLGALGAFMSYRKDGFADLMAHHLVEQVPTKPSRNAGGGLNNSKILKDGNENISIECTMQPSN